MCGIVAYIGHKPARPLLLEGLKRLEYRGYDSAGLAVLDSTLDVARTVGRVRVLEEMLEGRDGFDGTVGIAHTRWATHGEVTEANAHPHRDDVAAGHGIALIHNGIIENYGVLRRYLEEKGHAFTSETDTEVLAHLIGELYDGDLEQAVQGALREVTGAYAIAVICREEPDVLVVARKGSPLMVGVGKDEYIVASDSSAIVAHTTQAFHLDDYTVARLTRDSFRTTTIDNVPITPQIRELEVDLDQIDLGSYEHYMLKEICEQPQALRLCLKGRIDTREGQVVLGGIADFARELVKARRVILVGQGTALHAAMIGEYLMEDLAKIPTEVEFSSEFRYRNPIVEDGTVVIAISQSGETADTIAAMHEAKQRGALALGIVNVVGSTIARETDAGVYLRVGPEIGVASTKAFLGQVMVATLLAGFIGRRRYLSADYVAGLLGELEAIPDRIEKALTLSDRIREMASRYVERENWLFLGRGHNYPVAMEGALKLKEISYIHAEGMPAAEMKHGPIALIDDGMPVVFVATRNSQYDKGGRHGGGRRDPRALRGGPLRARRAGADPADGDGGAAPAPRLPRGRAPRQGRGQAAQPRQERDRGVVALPIPPPRPASSRSPPPPPAAATTPRVATGR
jgi:glucosamine--fructose-6-phosphate aminotransferase (isomerizing)